MRQSSVCILRVETDRDRTLITMRVEHYRQGGLPGIPRTEHFSRAEDAIDSVAAFLRSHMPRGSP